MWLFVGFVLVSWAGVYILDKQHVQQKELGRFRDSTRSESLSAKKRLDRWFEMLGRRFGVAVDYRSKASKGDDDMAAKLRAAGLETISDRGKYAAIRLVSYGSWPVISLYGWMTFRPYYATVTMLFSFAFVVIMPHLWLSRRTIHRLEEIQRELPLVIDLTNLATSAGWDLSAALEKVVDSLAPEFPNHPLIKELKKARILVESGYTWGEALARVSRKLSDDTVTRVTHALVQAMEQGGDRSAQLGGIAADAQRTYYAALDKRLASIPVKALLVTVALFLTYFAILLAPALVGVTGGMETL